MRRVISGKWGENSNLNLNLKTSQAMFGFYSQEFGLEFELEFENKSIDVQLL